MPSIVSLLATFIHLFSIIKFKMRYTLTLSISDIKHLGSYFWKTTKLAACAICKILSEILKYGEISYLHLLI